MTRAEMSRQVVDSVRARGSLIIDPKDESQGPSQSPGQERMLAWDEDGTTLAIDAAMHLRHAPVAIVGPGIDAETFGIALDVPRVLTANDPMAIAMSMGGPVWAIGCPPGTNTAIAALVDTIPGPGAGTTPGPGSPRDISPAPRIVSALRALQESRVVPPSEPMPDSPMGAYVPWGTWFEDLPARLRLIAQRCAACARVLYPPRGACPACGATTFTQLALPREATVYAATRIGRGGAPSEFALEQAQVGAYWVAVVEWPEHKVRVTARLSGYEESGPTIGDAVRPVVRRLFAQEGKTRYGVKFERKG